MNISAAELIDYVSNIRFTPEACLGHMLSFHEYETVQRIVEAAVSIVNTNNPDSTERVLNTTAAYVKTLTKQSPPSNAVILTILYLLKGLVISSEMVMKYKSPDAFLETYPEFSSRDINEQNLLRQNANWMHMLFLIIPAKKNKGLALDVVPKFVEGFTVTYITGSGQTRQTADRVKIYEREGNVQPAKRYKWKAKGAEQPKRVYKKRDMQKKFHATSTSIHNKHARNTLRRVAEGIILSTGTDMVETAEYDVLTTCEYKDANDCCVLKPPSPVPPVPFARRESSFGRTAAAVHFDHCQGPNALLRSMSILSDTSVDTSIGVPSMRSSVSNDSAKWSSVGSDEFDDEIEDFQPSDPQQFLFAPHLYEEYCR